MRTLVPMLAAFAAAGCTAARPVTQVRAEEVVQVQPDRVARCRYLGAVRGTQANAGSVGGDEPWPRWPRAAAANEDHAIEDARGQVARMGGNAFAVTHRESSMWRSVVQADAYLCPSWEPVPGLAPTERPFAR